MVSALTLYAQPATLSPTPIQRFFDASGNPLVGGLIYTCVAGSTCGAAGSTPQITYSAVDTSGNGTSANQNPIVLDSTGSASIFTVTALSYKFVVTDKNGVILLTQDNIRNAPSNQSFGSITTTGGVTVGTILTTPIIRSSLTGNNDNFGQLAFTASTTSAAYTFTSSYANKPICVTSPDGAAASLYPTVTLSGSTWSLVLTAAATFTGNGNYHCGLKP